MRVPKWISKSPLIAEPPDDPDQQGAAALHDLTGPVGVLQHLGIPRLVVVGGDSRLAATRQLTREKGRGEGKKVPDTVALGDRSRAGLNLFFGPLLSRSFSSVADQGRKNDMGKLWRPPRLVLRLSPSPPLPHDQRDDK